VNFDSWQEQKAFPFYRTSRPPLRSTQPLTHWVSGLFPPVVKQTWPEPFLSHAFMVLIGTTILMSLPSINTFCSFSLFIEPVGMADSQNKCLSLPQKRTCCSRDKRIWSRDHVVNDSVIYKIFGSLMFEVSPCHWWKDSGLLGCNVW
jgi:hypothetical protein